MAYNIGDVIKIENSYWIIYMVKGEDMDIINSFGIRKEKIGTGVIIRNVEDDLDLKRDIGKLIFNNNGKWFYICGQGNVTVNIRM